MTSPIDSKAYKQDAPEFGHKMLKYYSLDPNYINLNNGSYGATPKPVQLAIDELTAKIEAYPDLFHRISYLPMLVEARARVASLIGAKTDEVVFVENDSMGINTVLRNFQWEEGDMIISFSTTFNAISRAVQYLCDIRPHPTSSIISLTFPTTHAEIILQFKAHLRNNPARPGRRRVVIIDSIISRPGVLLPWQEMVKICKEEGAWSVVDAAHSIGQEVGVNLSQSAPDFWVSNCHKWLSAKRSCAVLYVPERNQHIIKSPIPTPELYSSPSELVIQPSFARLFEWTGTIDWTRYLTVPDALEFREWMGGEKKINEYCHDLALKGGQALAKTFGTSVLDPTGELTLNMVNVELPLSGNVDVQLRAKIYARLLHGMLVEKKTFSAHFYHNGKWWIRCSVQVWNELDDFDKIGKLWLEACEGVKRDFGLINNDS